MKFELYVITNEGKREFFGSYIVYRDASRARDVLRDIGAGTAFEIVEVPA